VTSLSRPNQAAVGLTKRVVEFFWRLSS
jgi:hypothetical protein